MPKLKESSAAAGGIALLFFRMMLLCDFSISAEAFVAPPQRHTTICHHRPTIPEQSSSSNGNKMATTTLTQPLSVLSQEMKFLDLERTGDDVDHDDEAAVSASLYLNPAASKLAPNVQVSWEPVAADTVMQLAKISNPSRPLMVGVVGIPGSGKSTSCEILAAYLEEQVEAMVMPMDGYHMSLEELGQLEDSDDKIYRRGATDTFNPSALARDLERIAHGKEPTVHIPGFDHALGDPVTDQHSFERSRHQVVICEGLYLLHDRDGWEHIQKFLDWTIFIEADVDICIDRLKERNKCIPGYTPEQIELRCEEVDRVNAELASLTAGKYASMVVQTGAVLPKKNEDDTCEVE